MLSDRVIDIKLWVSFVPLMYSRGSQSWLLSFGGNFFTNTDARVPPLDLDHVGVLSGIAVLQSCLGDFIVGPE